MYGTPARTNFQPVSTRAVTETARKSTVQLPHGCWWLIPTAFFCPSRLLEEGAGDSS